MPDWSYRTILRPLMIRLGAERSRRLAVSTLSTLSRVPFGVKVIDFLGHMRPDPRLRTRAGALELAGPIALGALIDPRGDALPAFSRFGVGLIEVGPVAEQGSDALPRWRVDLQQRTIDTAQPLTAAVEEVARNLERSAARAPVCVRIAKQDRAAVQRIVERLRKTAAAFVADHAKVDDVADALPPRGADRPLVFSAERIHPDADGTWLSVRHGQSSMNETIRSIRASAPDRIVVATGATTPEEARLLLDAGANIVAIDAGLVCSGPGLVKRCNEALLSERASSADEAAHIPHPQSRAAEPAAALPQAREAWFWATLMGVAMFIGGLMAVVIASTRVVLPYDESLCGLTRAEMATLNPRLLPFMAHDRVSLAGAMLSIGIFYVALGWSGIRRGAHWAHVTVIASATVGFLTFFTFLGFGYFDPFHAFVTAIVTQFLLLCLVMQPSPPQPPVAEWRETAAWRRGQWGQLHFNLMGIGLTVAGGVITVVGMTTVFVQSAVEFMRTTAAQLALSYERLLPLVAHDRATLGGMLIANGIAVWLSAQWGFRAGAKWLWLALAWGGNIAFFCALAVHVVVQYDDLLHLAPAVLGWLLWNIALALTRQWLCSAAAQMEDRQDLPVLH
ncbi:MAG TPA: hypothetical protein VE010_17995 [Thermoanaerobaculia bacterium]|nr:hypothetical protein [Thermoanaerobaculia bacterium]